MFACILLYTNINQTLVNSLHGLSYCVIGELECRVITGEYRHTCPLYTHITPSLQCHSPCYLFRSFRSIFVYNTTLSKHYYHIKTNSLRYL